MSVATALQTTDILCAIPEQLSVEHYKRRFRGKRRADLARLARVCTAFVDPALRVLWRTLPGAGPLLCLLSCVDVVRHEHYTEFVLGRAVVAEEWERFHHYARYVQVIDQHDNIRPDCGPEPYRGELIEHVLQQAILLSNGGKPFLPHMHRLSWVSTGIFGHLVWPPRDITIPNYPSPLFLIGPSTQHLVLHYSSSSQGPNRSLESIVTGISLLALELHTLVLHNKYDGQSHVPPDAPNCALSALSRYMNLRRLDVSGRTSTFSHRFIHTLSNLPRLASLRLCLSHIDVDSVEPKRALAALETLELTVVHMDALVSLFKVVSIPRLCKLSLHWCNSARVDQLPWSSWSSTLRILRVCISGLPRPDFQEPPWHLMPLIQPVLGLHDLQELTVHTRDTSLVWYDDDALVMSQSWPKLTAFLVSGGFHEPRLSSRTLWHFATNCLDLEQLMLPIIRDPDVDHSDLPVPQPHSHLRTLLLECIEVACMACYARYIIQMFPNLRVDNQNDCVRFPHNPRQYNDKRQLRKERQRQKDIEGARSSADRL